MPHNCRELKRRGRNMQLGSEYDHTSGGCSDQDRLKPSMRPYPNLTKAEQNPEHISMLK